MPILYANLVIRDRPAMLLVGEGERLSQEKGLSELLISLLASRIPTRFHPHRLLRDTQLCRTDRFRQSTSDSVPPSQVT